MEFEIAITLKLNVYVKTKFSTKVIFFSIRKSILIHRGCKKFEQLFLPAFFLVGSVV